MKRLLLVAAVSIPVMAFGFGGWAITTVEDVPEYVVAGKPFDLSYSVRQHGVSLLTRLGGAVTITSGRNAKNFATVELGEGMYRSRITIPTAGTWDVNISTGFMNSGVTLPLKVIAADAATPAPMSAFERGQQLFVAKGCASCHTHQLTKDVTVAQIGPDLSEPKFAAPYLERFLTNPSIKTDWRNSNRMPNLGLKQAEITALVAFLNKNK